MNELSLEQSDEFVVYVATQLVAAGKELNAYTGAVLLRLLAQRRAKSVPQPDTE